jgi:hypothetical protein
LQTVCEAHGAAPANGEDKLEEVHRALTVASGTVDVDQGVRFDDKWTRAELSVVEEHLHARNMQQALVKPRADPSPFTLQDSPLRRCAIARAVYIFPLGEVVSSIQLGQ